jgi:hypothetical protein
MTCGGSHLGFPIGIKNRGPMSVHWMVLYKLCVFCSDMKFKMAATAGFSLTLDPMGKMFQNASSHFPIVFNVNLCIAVAAILDFRSAYKTETL